MGKLVGKVVGKFKPKPPPTTPATQKLEEAVSRLEKLYSNETTSCNETVSICNETAYYVMTDYGVWNKLNELCESLGGALAIPHDADELAGIVKAIDDQNARFGIKSNHQDWTGPYANLQYVYFGKTDHSSHTCPCYDLKERRTNTDKGCSCYAGFRAVCELCVKV